MNRFGIPFHDVLWMVLVGLTFALLAEFVGLSAAVAFLPAAIIGTALAAIMMRSVIKPNATATNDSKTEGN